MSKAAKIYWSMFGMTNVDQKQLDVVDAWLIEHPFNNISTMRQSDESIPFATEGQIIHYLNPLPSPWPVMTRAEARAASKHKYWTGKPCKHGHVSMRYTASGICCECNTVNCRNSRNRGNDGMVQLRGLFIYPEHEEMVRNYVASLNANRRQG